jgi:phage shock protein A
MGRLARAIRGFFGKLLTGVEQRNPEILLENAVQDELENLKKLQVAAAATPPSRWSSRSRRPRRSWPT